MLAGGRWPARVRAEALPPLDRGEEADAVAAEVIEKARVAGMRADHPDQALGVAHQPVPVKLVRAARGTKRLCEGAHLVVDRMQHLGRNGASAR